MSDDPFVSALQKLRTIALRQSMLVDEACAKMPETMRAEAKADAEGFAALARMADLISADRVLLDAFKAASRRVARA